MSDNSKLNLAFEDIKKIDHKLALIMHRKLPLLLKRKKSYIDYNDYYPVYAFDARSLPQGRSWWYDMSVLLDRFNSDDFTRGMRNVDLLELHLKLLKLNEGGYKQLNMFTNRHKPIISTYRRTNV